MGSLTMSSTVSLVIWSETPSSAPGRGSGTGKGMEAGAGEE